MNLRSNWEARVTGAFTELNIAEDAPGDIVGGYDYFKFRMKGQYEIVVDPDEIYVITGTLHMEKNGEFLADFEDVIVYIHLDDWANQFQILIGDHTLVGSLLP